MKEYVKSFLKDFEYQEKDANFLYASFCRIVLNEKANTLFNEAIQMYKDNIKCDYGKVLALSKEAGECVNVHEYTAGLLVFICLSKHLKELYKERGLSDELFHNSVLDLRYKLEECKLVKGIVGSFVAWWFPGFFDLTRFAFGRLQFELTEFAADSYEKDGKSLKRGDTVIGVHIPRTETPIDKKSCDDAYNQAKEFFKDKITNNDIAFVCHSWLLYSKTLNVFPEKTNTRRFASEFEILWDTHDDIGVYNDAWRLYDMDYTGSVEDYPENTSMRRAYKQYLLEGGRTGEGYGVFFAK